MARRPEVFESFYTLASPHEIALEALLLRAVVVDDINHAPTYAKWRAIGDGLDATEGHWLCADPVGFQVDLNHITCLGNAHLEITQSECDDIKPALAEFLQLDELEFFIGASQRWYARSKTPFDVKTLPLSLITGTDLRATWQSQQLNKDWQSRFTEIQMLLNGLPFQQQRRQQRLPTIDGLWFWGAGELSSFGDIKPVNIVSDAAMAKGMASTLGLACQEQFEPGSAEQQIIYIEEHTPKWIEIFEEMATHLNASKHGALRVITPTQTYQPQSWMLRLVNRIKRQFN